MVAWGAPGQDGKPALIFADSLRRVLERLGRPRPGDSG
jgi:hypothetical protein